MNEGICSVCAGTGIPMSGPPCICGGTGLTSDELHGLRMAILTKDTEIERLRGLLRRSEWYLRHDQECPLRFTRERGSGLSKSHCDCGLHRLDEEIDSALGTSDQPSAWARLNEGEENGKMAPLQPSGRTLAEVKAGLPEERRKRVEGRTRELIDQPSSVQEAANHLVTGGSLSLDEESVLYGNLPDLYVTSDDKSAG